MPDPCSTRNAHLGRLPVTVRYQLSNACSLLGNAVVAVVVPLVLLARTGDVMAAGSLALICAVPQMLAGFVGGVVLDRVNRRDVCVVSDLISALSVALLPVVDAMWGLSFGWFVALGLLGAVGDVPGMSARDTLMPAACEADGVDLQRFLGVNQAVDAAVSVLGPATAALLMGLLGDVRALWVTAALSLLGAAFALVIPREVGCPGSAPGIPAGAGPARARRRVHARELAADGLDVLFATDSLMRASILLSFGVTMAMGAFSGIVLPAHFTELGEPELLGYVVSALGVGMFAGSVGYAALAPRLSQRGWLVVSLLGMVVGVAFLGTLPGFGALLAAAAATGLAAGPVSALLGYFVYARIPEARRGVGMGALNALYLVVAPAGAFVGSMLVASLGLRLAGLALVGLWAAVTAAGLLSKTLCHLED